MGTALRHDDDAAISGVRLRVAGSHAEEDETGGSGRQVPEQQFAGTRSATALWRAGHEAAGISYAQTAKSLGIDPRFASRMGDASSGKVANLDHILGAPPAVCRAIGRALEAAGAPTMAHARSVDQAALAIVVAAADLSRAVISGDDAAIGRAAHALDDARMAFRAARAAK